MKPSYSLIIRSDKKTRNDIVPIYLRVTYNRKKSLYFTGIKIQEKYWNSDKQEVRRSYPTSTIYNTELIDLKIEAQKIGFKLQSQKNVTAQAIVQKLKGINPENFFKFAEGFCARLDKSGSIRRKKQTNVLINKLRGMVKSEDLVFSDITPSFLEDFEVYLRVDIGNAQNTINKNFERLKMIIVDAIARGIHDKNPFVKFKIPPRQSSKKEALTFDQIRKIEGLDLTEHKHLVDIRNYFMFSFYNAGIRFGDICRLKWENIQDGRLKYLMSKSTHTQKPKWKNIKLGRQSLDILGYYINTNNESEYIFPILNDTTSVDDPEVFDRVKSSKNAKVNKGLQELAKLAGIDTHLSFHISRHSFARHATSMGMNIFAISNALAHSDLKTTQVYLKSFDENLLDKEMENLFSY